MNEKLKISFANFWDNTSIYGFLSKTFLFSYDYEFVDCTKEEADIVFISCFGNNKNWIGNPIIIYYTAENYTRLKTNLKYDYSISFGIDSPTNLFLPYCLCSSLDNYNTYNKRNEQSPKDKFCTFIISNSGSGDLANRRHNVFKHISSNYKKIDSIGPVYNNCNGFTLPRNMSTAVDYHKPYKFNLCFENSTSTDTFKYITEKIMNAYTYNTVPIYMGSNYVTEIYNPDSFINCNGLSDEQILSKIIEIDNNHSLYEDMLHQYPFVDKNLNYVEYREQRVKQFMDMILTNKGLID